jgi:hypothetical protein
MRIAAASFIVGPALCAAASVLEVLIAGMEVGFTNQPVLLFLSKMAPAKLRGALDILLQLVVTRILYLVPQFTRLASSLPTLRTTGPNKISLWS